MADDNRPEWEFEIPMERFRMLCHCVTAIRHQWRMTGNDTSENWIEICLDRSGSWKRLPLHAMKFIQFNANHHNSLFSLTYQGEMARKRMGEIDAWEKKHAAERAAYERLKRKFEP